MATRFDSWNSARQRTKKKSRSKGGNLQGISLAIGRGIQQQPFPLSDVRQELDQLTIGQGFPASRYLPEVQIEQQVFSRKAG
jgi:hypothetical protein